MPPQLQTLILRGKALTDLPPPHQGFTLARVKATRTETSRCENHSPLELKDSKWDNKRYPLCGSAWRITDVHPHRVILSPGAAHVNCEFFGCMCTCTKWNFQIPWTNSAEPFFFCLYQRKTSEGSSEADVWKFGDTEPHAKLVCMGSYAAAKQGMNTKPLNRTNKASLCFGTKYWKWLFW